MHGKSCRRGHLVTVQQRTLSRVDAEAMTESDDDAEMKNTNCIHVTVCVGITVAPVGPGRQVPPVLFCFQQACRTVSQACLRIRIGSLIIRHCEQSCNNKACIALSCNCETPP